MGILHAAYRTYENHQARAGVEEVGKEALTPVAHAIQNAQIELEIDTDGRFQKAVPVEKDESKTIIPVTLASANRTGDNTKAHPLSDQLRYLAPFGGDKFSAYVEQLETWAGSAFSHPKVEAVLKHIQGETIVADLVRAGLISVNEQGVPAGGKLNSTEYGKCLVRWRVIPPPDGGKSACWADPTLFDAYSKFYAEQCKQEEQDICLLTGQMDMVCDMHPKGIISFSYGAKLVSANDSSGYTYRGRFTEASQAYNLGYQASQKAHNGLRWIASNYGKTLGGRAFLCWNPGGKSVPALPLFSSRGKNAAISTETPPPDIVSYRNELRQTLSGYKMNLPQTDDVVIASLDAATTGRLSVTYYNELKASDFFDRIEYWYDSLCWETRRGTVSPSLRQIVNCAFGTQRDKGIEAGDRVLGEHVQRLLRCMVDRQPFPADIQRALVTKCGNPLAYTPENRERLLETTCAVMRKYTYDKYHKEVWNMALDPSNTDRSYLFGRLLAVAELVERRTYDRDEKREPNAIRMQAVFSQRPLYAWRIIHESLEPYFKRIKPIPRENYRRIIEEIMDMLPDIPESDLGKRLDDSYLMGYYHQRSALTPKKSDTVKEENEHESTEQ